MVNLQRVEGVIVRLGVPETKYGEYLVLWSKEFNHSYVLREDVSSQEWDDAFVCEWKEYDVSLTLDLPGPEGIQTRAYNLRKPAIATCDPSTRADQYYTDIHNPRRVNVFTTVEGDHLARPTVKFKDLFKVPPPTMANNSVDGVFIKRANIRAADLRDLQKFNISEFEGVVELEKVTKRNEAQPWRITQFVFDGKELSIQGWLSRLGMVRHGPGGSLVPRNSACIPPDTLRLRQSGGPSRFASVGNPEPAPLPPPPVIPFGGLSEDQILPPAVSDEPSPIPAATSIVLTGTTNNTPSAQSWSEEEFPAIRETPTQTADFPAKDGVTIGRTLQDASLIHVMGLVVHQQEDRWVFYSKHFSNSTRTYLYLDSGLEVRIGQWYSLVVSGGYLPELIDFSHVTEMKEINPPDGIVMRVFPRMDFPQYADILIVTTAAVVLTGGFYHIFCSKLGSLCLPKDADKYIDFSKLKRTVVEVTFYIGGLLVRRFHGPDAIARQLTEPVVPYDIKTQEGADSFFNDPFIIPSNCNEDWIKKEEPYMDPSVHSTSADISVNPSIQPPSPNLSRELNDLDISATPQAAVDSRFATPANVTSSPKHQRSACRALFPREHKPQLSISNQSGTTVEGTRSCGPIDPIYDITVNLEKECIDSTFIIEVIAMIAFIKEEFIVAYCPLKDYDKIIIPWDVLRQSAYVADGHPVEVGNWMSVHVHPRQTQSFDASSPPQFTHFATSDPEYVRQLCHLEISSAVDNWKQRCIEGQYQYLIEIDLSERYITATHLNKEFYIFETKQQVEVIVPAYRFEPLKKMDYPQFVRFWAVRGIFLFNRTLHLVADAEVEVIKDGKTMTYLIPYGHPPLKMSSAKQEPPACPPAKKAPVVETSPSYPEDVPIRPMEELPMPPTDELILPPPEYLPLAPPEMLPQSLPEEMPLSSPEENHLIPPEEVSFVKEVLLDEKALENAYSERSCLLEDACSSFSTAEQGSPSVFSYLGEAKSESSSVMKKAHGALFCLDSEEISNLFLEEGMKDVLEHLIGLRDAVINGEASLDAFKLIFERST